MAGYAVGIASETKAFKQGVETGIIRPIEDAQKALVDLGRSRGPDQLEQGMRDAQRRTEELADETKDTARTIEREYKDSYRKLKSSAGDAFDGAKRGADEFKDEAKSSAREAAASFKEPADALDAVQEIAANAFGGFGPAGVAAGAAAAIGIGAVTSILQTQQEEADKLKEKLAGMYSEAVEAGRDYIDEAQIVAGVNDILFNPDNESIYRQAKADAETLGVTVNDVLRAQAGDEEKINLLRESRKRLAEEALDPKRTGVDLTLTEAAELGKAIQRYEDLKGLHDENNARAERALEIEADLGTEQSENTKRARDADTARWQAYQENIAKARAAAAQPVTMNVNVSTAEAERRLAELANRRYEIEVGVRYRNGKEVMQ